MRSSSAAAWRSSIREVKHLLRVLEEDVGARVGLIEVEKAQSRMAFPAQQLCRQTVGRHQPVAPVAIGEKDGHARHQQRLRQPVHDRAEQPVQIRLRAQAAAEGDQGLAVVVALMVEDPVDPVLNGAFERFEKLRRDNDGGDQAPCSRAGQAGVNQLGRDRDCSEIKADQCSRRQGVGDAALEDQVDVHQAVTNDGPAKGKRQKDQANSPQLGQNAGNRNAGEKRDDIQHREGDDGEQSSPGQPLQLLAAKRVRLAEIVAEENQGSEHVIERQVAHGELVQTGFQQLGRLAIATPPRFAAR